MQLQTIVAEILKRSDEAYVGVSEDRARRAFYTALINTLSLGQFDDYEAFGFFKRKNVIIPSGVETSIDIDATLLGNKYLTIRSIYFEPGKNFNEEEEGFITPITQKDLARINMGAFKPEYDYKYHQLGNKLYLYPADKWGSKHVIIEYVIAPLPYNDTKPTPPLTTEWYDDTEMTGFVTEGFEEKLIELASAIFKKELNDAS